MGSRFARLALLLCLSACGGGEKAGGDGAPGGGPEELPELELWGYVRHEPTGLASEAAIGPVGLASLRQSTDKAHALIHVSGFT